MSTATWTDPIREGDFPEAWTDSLGMVVCLHGNGWFIFRENIERKDNPTARSWSDHLGLYWYVVVFGSYGRLFSFSRKNGRLSCNRNIELTRNVFFECFS